MLCKLLKDATSNPHSLSYLWVNLGAGWLQLPLSCSLSIRAVVFFHCSILDCRGASILVRKALREREREWQRVVHCLLGDCMATPSVSWSHITHGLSHTLGSTLRLKFILSLQCFHAPLQHARAHSKQQNYSKRYTPQYTALHTSTCSCVHLLCVVCMYSIQALYCTSQGDYECSIRSKLQIQQWCVYTNAHYKKALLHPINNKK